MTTFQLIVIGCYLALGATFVLAIGHVAAVQFPILSHRRLKLTALFFLWPLIVPTLPLILIGGFVWLYLRGEKKPRHVGSRPIR
jgi:hypothetical protein